jgi:hypothetical protein
MEQLKLIRRQIFFFGPQAATSPDQASGIRPEHQCSLEHSIIIV